MAYKWDGNEAEGRLDFEIIDFKGNVKNGYRLYNELGFVTEEYTEQLQQSKTTTEYDCTEDFCWEQKSQTETGAGATKMTTKTEYRWDGMTRKHEMVIETEGNPFTVKASGYTIYNDYAQSKSITNLLKVIER